MPKNTSTKISDEIKRKIEFQVGSESSQIYRLLLSIGGHHIVTASEGKILEDMGNSQDECVREGAALR